MSPDTLAHRLTSDFSVICEIERVLRRRASMPGLEYDKSKFGGHKLQIQRILDALNAPTLSLNRDGDAGELGLQSLSLDFRDAAMASASENGRGWHRLRRYPENC